MFGHLYKYRLKTFLYDKTELFWTALFPLFLCTCFYVAFSNIDNAVYKFHLIKTAVVIEKEDPAFAAFLDSISDDTENNAMLQITYTDSDTADNLLKNDEVEVIITVNDDITLNVSKEGINQTALYNVINEYLQKSSLKVMPVKGTSSVKSTSIVSKNVSSTITYFFSLIAMTALFGNFLGVQCSRQLKANITPEGMRRCISPVKRAVAVFADFLAACTLHLLSMTLLLIYMIFILKLNMGGLYGYIILVCIAGSLVGVASGMFVGSIPKLGLNGQVALSLIFSLGSSFLSGLMVAEVKLYIEHTVPVINRINPATLISDSLYSLLVYNTHERLFTNIITLVAYALILCMASFFMTRRTRYANL